MEDAVGSRFAKGEPEECRSRHSHDCAYSLLSVSMLLIKDFFSGLTQYQSEPCVVSAMSAVAPFTVLPL